MSILASMSNQSLDDFFGQTVDAPLTALEFAEASWGLGSAGVSLYPAQRVIIKAYYGIALDDNEHGFPLDRPLEPAICDDGLERVKGFEHLDVLYEDVAGPVRRYNKVKGRYYKNVVPIDTDFRRSERNFFTEAGYLRWLYEQGRSNVKEVVPGRARSHLVLCIGRRSGKSFLSAFIMSYSSYCLINLQNPQAYYGLPDGEEIFLLAIATGKEQAATMYGKVSTIYDSSSFFKTYMANKTATFSRLQTPHDQRKHGSYSTNPSAKASLYISFLGAKAKNLRGQAYFVIVFDEYAFTPDRGKDSAEELYKAGSPAQATFSPKDPETLEDIGPSDADMVMISTPNGRRGEFYEHYRNGFKKNSEASTNMLCIRAPTWEINPSVPVSRFKAEYEKDPQGFYQEYGAEFVAGSSSFFRDPRDIDSCVNLQLKRRKRGIKGRTYFAGIDVGLATDGTSIAIGHIETCLVTGRKTIVIDVVDHIQAKYGEHEEYNKLNFDEVATWIDNYSKNFYIANGIFDQANGIVLEQTLARMGSTQYKMQKFSPSMKNEMWRTLRDYVFSGGISFYMPDGPEQPKMQQTYLEELKTLEETRSGSRISVEAPRGPGLHDDRADAICRMVWLATQDIPAVSNNKAPIRVYTNITSSSIPSMGGGSRSNSYNTLFNSYKK
jgi:hypothetical protein